MLRPNKHSDPQLTLLPVTGELLKKLRQKRSCTIADLRQYLDDIGPDRSPLLLPSIALLFLLGVAEYRRKTDCVEYVGP
jgi:hypothetical protein